MKILNVIDEDIVNYKKISMYIALPFCTMKCNADAGKDICHNTGLQNSQWIDIATNVIVERYLNNPISKAIVIAGMEPFDSRFDLIPLITEFRVKYECNDDLIIYTGYTEEELNGSAKCTHLTEAQQAVLTQLYKSVKEFDNIIVKFGRYKEGDKPHFDETLGVYLSSSNQYAKRIS